MAWLETVTLTGGFISALASVSTSDTYLPNVEDCYRYLDAQEQRYELQPRSQKAQLSVTFKQSGYDYRVIRTCVAEK